MRACVRWILAFEELLLESFTLRGHKVVRNRRNTGKGGVDGQVAIRGQVWLLQAKRYASTIRPQHAEAFAAACRVRGVSGFLIHTDRTGALGRIAFARHGHVELISGQRLLAFIAGTPLEITGVRV